jgi:hypothetical protein
MGRNRCREPRDRRRRRRPRCWDDRRERRRHGRRRDHRPGVQRRRSAAPTTISPASSATAPFRRGRGDDLSQTQAATAQFTVRDNTGLFNYKNPASPLYGQIETMMHPIRWRIRSGGVMEDEVLGVHATHHPPAGPAQGRHGLPVRRSLLPARQREARHRGARLRRRPGPRSARSWTPIGWPDSRGHAASTSATTSPTSAPTGSKTCLQLIGDLLTAERGDFYIRGDGVPVYEARYARFLKPATRDDHRPHDRRPA